MDSAQPRGPLDRWLVALWFLPVLTSIPYWFVCDDAFISFRYARNLLRGDGLVFNVGERVEGYTNFLWVLELSALWGALGIRPEIAAPVLGELFTVGTAALVAALALRGPAERPRRAAVLALLLFATNRSVAVWATSGLETRQFTFFVTLGLYLLWRWRDGERWLAGGSAALAAATLTRPEGLLLGPILLACAGAWQLAERRATARAVIATAAPFVLVVGAHLLWRHAYYGEWLPNTYYAKTVRPWWDAGARYLGILAIEHALYLLIPLAVVGARARWRRGDPLHLALFAWGAPYAVYLARLGGDHFEFRVVDELWPPLSLAVAEGVVHLAGASPRRFAFGAALTIAYQLGLPLAHDAQAFQLRQRSETMRMKVTVTTGNAPWLWLLPPTPLLLGTYTTWSHWLHDHAIALRQREHAIYARLMRSRYGGFRRFEDVPLFPPEAVTSEPAVGVISFYLPGLTLIDEKGLNDAVIARNPVERPNAKRQMAHDRSPPKGYLDSRGVNLHVEGLGPDPVAAFRYAAYAVQLDERTWMAISADSAEVVEGLFPGRRIAARSVPPRDRFSWGDAEWEVVRWLGQFDRHLAGWNTEGSAFDGQPVQGPARGQAGVHGFEGRALVNTYGERGGGPQGTARSVAFVPVAGEALSFLVGGGPGAAVVLVGPDGALGRWTGSGGDALERVVVPLEPYVGQTVHLELQDPTSDAYLLVDAVAIVTRRP